MSEVSQVETDGSVRVDDGVGVDDSVRAQARQRIEKRRNLQAGSVAYVVFNTFFVVIWAMTGGGYFWPAWIMAAWGAGMLMGWWDYWRKPLTEADIDAELRRISGSTEPAPR